MALVMGERRPLCSLCSPEESEELLLREGRGKQSGLFWVTASMSGVYPPGPGVLMSHFSSPRHFSNRPHIISGFRTAL